MGGLSQETDYLDEFAVVWDSPVGASADQYGQPRVGASREIAAKWEIGEGLSNHPQSNSKTGSGKVVVAERITIGSILWQGKTADYVLTSGTPKDLYEVVSYQGIGDVKCRNQYRALTLTRFKSQIPTST